MEDEERQTLNGDANEMEVDNTASANQAGAIISYNMTDIQHDFDVVDESENHIVLSEYSGEFSTYQPATLPLPNPSSSQDITDEFHANETTNRQDLIPNNPISLLSTSSVKPKSHNTLVPSTSSSSTQKLPSSSSAPKTMSSSAQKSSSSVQKASFPQKNATSTNDMESVRRKLDNCISSLSAKIADKQERSPHAPFLAYLGTKLPSVPKNQLGR